MIKGLSYAIGVSVALATTCHIAAAADIQAGRVIAERWCATCHVVGHGRAGSDAVPSFPTIASRPGANEDTLHRALGDPHPRMPDPNLTNREIDDVVAYILSLKR